MLRSSQAHHNRCKRGLVADALCCGAVHLSCTPHPYHVCRVLVPSIAFVEFQSSAQASIAAVRVSKMQIFGRDVDARLFRGYRGDDVSFSDDRDRETLAMLPHSERRGDDDGRSGAYRPSLPLLQRRGVLESGSHRSMEQELWDNASLRVDLRHVRVLTRGWIVAVVVAAVGNSTCAM